MPAAKTLGTSYQSWAKSHHTTGWRGQENIQEIVFPQAEGDQCRPLHCAPLCTPAPISQDFPGHCLGVCVTLSAGEYWLEILANFFSLWVLPCVWQDPREALRRTEVLSERVRCLFVLMRPLAFPVLLCPAGINGSVSTRVGGWICWGWVDR